MSSFQVKNSPMRMPAIFFGHGSPMNALEENRYTDVWRRLGSSVPRPRAILAISAHWTTRGTAITAMGAPKTIHDFGGFPQALFDMRYPAPGDPALAAAIAEKLKPLDVRLDQEWGIDHGTWSVLVKAFPDADIPVIQLSIDMTKPAAYHLALGEQLSPLRDEGILIIGSGNVVHNLQMMRRDGPAPGWAVRFNDQVRDAVARRDFDALADEASWDADARMAVPTIEHFLPFLYVVGTRHGDENEPLSIAVDGIELGAISMLTVVVGDIAGFDKHPGFDTNRLQQTGI